MNYGLEIYFDQKIADYLVGDITLEEINKWLDSMEPQYYDSTDAIPIFSDKLNKLKESRGKINKKECEFCKGWGKDGQSHFCYPCDGKGVIVI